MGFGEDATHTTNAESKLAMMQADDLPFPLVHPTNIIIDYEKDQRTEKIFFTRKKKKSLKEKMKKKLRLKR